jgi:hypothetical protein
MKLPPFGKELASRLKHRNSPFHVVVTIGVDCWKRAEQWNSCPNDVIAMVLPAGADPRMYCWPVRDQLVVIEAACGPSDDDLRDLAAVLLAYGADVITIISRDGTNEFHQYIAEGREAAA